MNTLIRATSELPTPLLVTASFLVAFVFVFVVWFVIPGVRHWFLLKAIQRRLTDVRDNDADALTEIFSIDGRLAHLWSEYRDTLHTQTDAQGGKTRVVAVRSTVPAETFFNSQYVVDSRLRTEFFRHLPGIFTGIGIIGTFTGLIGGLREFQTGLASSQQTNSPSGTSAAVGSLLHEVSRAFFVSASAIAAAMVVTFIEKLLIASLYRRTEEISHEIDARFGAGAGEEYLSRIVHASEDSASQAKILKDALVNDLRALLREVTDTQITSFQADNRALATAISGSIAQSLSEPMKDIAGTVRAASGDQSATAARMLQDVISGFAQKLNDLFGGQISGINELNRDTASGMREVAQTLHVLVANIEAAQARSGDMMAQRMAEAVEKMEQRQESINNQTTQFVEQLRQLVSNSQTETSQKMQEALATLGQQIAGMVASIRAVNEQSLEGSRQREQSMADRATSAVTSMTGSVDGAVREMAAASSRMQDAVAIIGQATSSALDKMNYGADTLQAAATNFANAGDKVSMSMGHVSSVSGKLVELTGAMGAGASALQQTVGDYRAQREAVSGLVIELRAIVETAKTEVSLTAEVLARIQSASEKLSAAQVQIDLYLGGVSAVLSEAHQSFAEATLKTLDRANLDFHSKLTSAVQLLSSSIQELETTLSSK
jgi:hypothetical protein